MKMICTGGPYGDSMCSYDVQLDREYTVKEFMEAVLKEKPKEWGELVVTTDFKYMYSKQQDTCEYTHGEIKKHFKKAETAGQTIAEVKAHGGWSSMNYFIKCK